MAPPLASALAILLAVAASAAPERITPAAAKAELRRDFARGEDLKSMDFTGQPGTLVELLEQARYVQAGREPGDEKETYVAFIRSVARRLGAVPEDAVARYGERVRPNRSAEATKKEVEARAAIAEDVRRNPGISAEKKARIAQDVSRTTDFLKRGMNGDGDFVAPSGAGARPATVVAKRVETQGDSVVYDSEGRRNWSNIPPQVQPTRLVTTEPPSATPFTGGIAYLPSAVNRALYSMAELGSHIDLKRGAEVAYEAVTGVLEEGKKALHTCYRFVKQALIDAGVIDAPNPQSTAVIGLRPGMASMFNRDVEKNPKILDELGYRRAKLDDLTDPSQVPQGSILIYGAKCGGMNYEDAGHAELTVSREEYDRVRVDKNAWDRKNPRAAHPYRIQPLDADEVPACHYTCTGRSMSYLRTYGKGPKACLRMYVPVKA